MISKSKKILLTIFEIIISVSLILSLFVPIIKVTYMGTSLSENGFGLLDFESDLVISKNEVWSVFFGAMYYLILASGFILFTYSIFQLVIVLLIKKSYFSTRSAWVVIFALIMSLLYFILGFIFSSIFESNYDIPPQGVSIITLSFIPLLIIIGLLIIYFVIVYFKIKNYDLYLDEEEKQYTQANKRYKKNIDANSLVEDARALKEYKKLLDEKVITQDEYDVIKVSLLNKLK